MRRLRAQLRSPASQPADRNAGRSGPRARVVASILAVAARLCLRPRAAPAPCFGHATPLVGKVSDLSRLGRDSKTVLVRRQASSFSYGKRKGGKGFGGEAEEEPRSPPKGTPGEDDKPPEEERGLAKDTRRGKSKALSTTKLKDLRDKTLALRQKREAELDEYEEGRAMIAKYGPKVAVMPEKVAQRAAKRGMVIGGSFYGTMIAVFAAGILLFKTQEIIIPPTLMAFVTLALLALAIAGSSYGMMSASWDEDREGSLLGTEEFGKNVKSIGEGFRRMSMQNEYEKAIQLRRERKKLLEAKEEKKKELLNE